MPGMRLFPTPVGVFLINRNSMLRIVSLPHARGGVSRTISRRHAGAPSSPRPWGCFFCFFEFKRHVTVFPTPVGVFLLLISRQILTARLPHARGGVSAPCVAWASVRMSSPRPWGCFHFPLFMRLNVRVFPTPVGVFLGHYSRFGYTDSLPHARGGVSAKTLAVFAPDASSPRPWGCFHLAMLERNDVGLFPTPVGVFPQGAYEKPAGASSSPRPWGCFSLNRPSKSTTNLFPTPVGVFPQNTAFRRILKALPHARGGVSVKGLQVYLFRRSSPRPWGCFRNR